MQQSYRFLAPKWFVTCLVVLLATPAAAQTPPQRIFQQPEQAAQALVKAAGENDQEALLDILGREHEDLIVTPDPQVLEQTRRVFYGAAQEQMALEEEDENTRILIVGDKEWPFPIPLVRENEGWRFDTAAGADEIINRRIGRNELEAIAMLQALADAQVEYASADRDGDQVLEYAQRIISSEGRRDGLYWPAADDAPAEDLSPMGPYISDAGDYLEGKKIGDPWYGYYFKTLTGQGENAPGGAHGYVINGNKIAGFGLLAFPAEYGASGIMTFIVNQQGVIHQQDLGEDTEAKVGAIQVYDPGPGWQRVDDSLAAATKVLGLPLLQDVTRVDMAMAVTVLPPVLYCIFYRAPSPGLESDTPTPPPGPMAAPQTG